jgi:hypothetical protein
MPNFPQLKTGAVMQYPGRKALLFSTQVYRFLDGSEQRFREQAQGQQRWIIALRQLTEAELDVLERFHESSLGQAGSFSFTDPWTDTVYPNCSFENGEAIALYRDTADAGTVLVVRQNWS